MVAQGTEKIKVKLGEGVAGSVAATGSICNIPDAYADERFSDAADKATGYKTESILASPVKDWDGNIVGVIQAINRRDNDEEDDASADGDQDGDEGKQGAAHAPSFSSADEEVMSYLALQAGIALNNATVFHAMSLSQERVRSLLDIIQSMHNNLGINSLMFTITQRAHTLVAAHRCTMFLLDEDKKELWSLQGEVNIRIPMDKGIAGECCTKNMTINIPDAYKDERFNQGMYACVYLIADITRSIRLLSGMLSCV
jgi:GAF domain-containing protein